MGVAVGQSGLVVKCPPGNQVVRGSNLTTAMEVENEKWTLG